MYNNTFLFDYQFLLKAGLLKRFECEILRKIFVNSYISVFDVQEDMSIIYIHLIYFVNIFFMLELRECVFSSALD